MNKMKPIYIVSYMSALMFAFQNCSTEVQFEEKVNGSVLKYEVDNGVLKVSEEFSSKVTGKQGMVDLVWVIDNSGSMSDEAEIVRNNLTAFVDHIQNQSDTKFMLMSEMGDSDQMVRIPYEDGDRFTQINRYISSYNSLYRIKDSMENGEFDNFFREGALKYFVVVTDDDSVYSGDNHKTIGGDEFYQYLQESLPGEAIKVSGFIGLSDSSGCKIANVGKEYLMLRDRTRGYMFDICEQDWTKNFDKLAKDVSLSANNKFSLNFDNIISIDKVVINGRSIDPKYVEVNGKSIIIKFNIDDFADNDELHFEVDYTSLIRVENKLVSM